MPITINTPTNDLKQSKAFYSALNFIALSASAPVAFTDGTFIVEINPDRFARAGLNMYKDSWASEVAALKQKTTIRKTEEGFLLNDLNGCWIYLKESAFPFNDLPEEQMETLSGNFSGISMESSDIEKSLAIWQTLGFEIKMGGPDKGYVVLAHADGFGLSLMQPMTCPHLFFNPSMTFFNGKDNLNLIAKIREAGIPITEEITHFNKEKIVDNIIIRDPGGYGFFVFSD